MTTTGRTPLPPGTRIGRFELVSELDRDEVSAVWAARIRGPRTAARAARVQVLEPRAAADLELRTLFLREARAASKIKHPAFAHVLDSGPHGTGGAYLATSYFDAASLSELLQAASERNVTLPLGVTLRIVHDVLDPLAEMHAVRLETAGSTRLLHGDLRPDAILVTLEGVTRLLPSCAGAAACRQPLASVVRRLAYKAPEQIRHEGVGASIDARADQFALGSVLWEAFAGRRQFGADEAGQLVRAVLTDPMFSISTAVPGIDPGVANLVDRLLCRDPEARFYDIEELSSELDRVAGLLIADRSEVELTVRELLGPRIEQRREQIRRKSQLTSSSGLRCQRRHSSGSVAVGRVVQVPAGNSVPHGFSPVLLPRPSRSRILRRLWLWRVPPRATGRGPPPVPKRGVNSAQPAPARASAEALQARSVPALIRPPPLPPGALPAMEDLDPPTQRTGSVRALKAAEPVAANAYPAELSAAVVESPPPPAGAPLPKLPGFLDDDDEVPTARPNELRTSPSDVGSTDASLADEPANSDDSPTQPDPSRTAPTLPPARGAGRHSKRSQLPMLGLLGLAVFAITFGIVALRRRADPPPVESQPTTEPSRPTPSETTTPAVSEPRPTVVESPSVSSSQPSSPAPEPEPTAAVAVPPPAPAPPATPATVPRSAKTGAVGDGEPTRRVEPKPRAPVVKQPVEQEPVEKPVPKRKPVDDRMLDDI